MTNANDLLWWDDEDGGCCLVWNSVDCGVFFQEGKYGAYVRIRNRKWIGIKCAHSTREAAMQGAVDAAEAAGVDFSKAPRWEGGLAQCCGVSALVSQASDGRLASRVFAFGDAVYYSFFDKNTELLARTAAIAVLRREVQELVEKAKGELGV